MNFAPLTWDETHMSDAYVAARKSKDRRTQVGAVIVSPTHDDRLMGYNGPLRGLNDDDETIYLKPSRGGPSPFMGHAERNAISNAARTGRHIRGSIMYCTLVSCEHCAADIVNGGLAEIIFHLTAMNQYDNLNLTQKTGLDVLTRGGVKIRFWEGQTLVRHILYDGAVIDLHQPVADVAKAVLNARNAAQAQARAYYEVPDMRYLYEKS